MNAQEAILRFNSLDESIMQRDEFYEPIFISWKNREVTTCNVGPSITLSIWAQRDLRSFLYTYSFVTTPFATDLW